MGLRDDLRRAAGATTGLIGATIGSVPGRYAEWAESRATAARYADVDDRLNKAVADALASGKDGTHDFPDPTGGDNDVDAPAVWSGKPVPSSRPPTEETKALGFDPFDMVALMGWREHPSALTFTSIERTCAQVPVITDIIRTRIAQFLLFLEPQTDKHAAGMEVRLCTGERETAASRKQAREIMDWYLHTGVDHPNRKGGPIPLKTFAAATMRDSLQYDQMTYEIIPDRKGRPSFLQAVDATTIRLVDPLIAEQEGLFAVQVIQNMATADFARGELAFAIRNPRTGIHTFGYGESEIETLVREITGFLWGLEYNRRFFSQGSSTKGILNFKGAIPDKHLAAFRRQWYAMVQGVSNAWRTPITNAEDLQWINLQMSNRDMEYSAWIDFLIKVCCARYLIAPEEINFSYGNTGQSQAMGQAPIEEKLKASRDLGLRPLVKWWFAQMNANVTSRIHPDFELAPVGFESDGASAEAELDDHRSRVYMTIDEVRAERGKKPLGPDAGGDVIRDATWLQRVQAKEAMAQQDAGGMPGMDEQPPEDEAPPEEGEPEPDHPTGGIELMDEDGQQVPSFQSGPPGYGEGDNGPEVAKSLVAGVVSRRRPKVVRYVTDF